MGLNDKKLVPVIQRNISVKDINIIQEDKRSAGGNRKDKPAGRRKIWRERPGGDGRGNGDKFRGNRRADQKIK